MRRIALIALILASVPVLAGSRAASAHSCASPVQIDPGESAAINIGIPAEAEAVVEVRIRVPSGFRITEAQLSGPWNGRRDGGDVIYTGGRIEPFTCGFFTIKGVAPKRGQLLFPVTTTAEDGTETVFDSDEPTDIHAAQLVQVGPPSTSGGSDDGSGLATAGIALAVVGGAVFMAQRLSRPANRRPQRGRRGVPSGRRGSGSSGRSGGRNTKRTKAGKAGKGRARRR